MRPSGAVPSLQNRAACGAHAPALRGLASAARVLAALLPVLAAGCGGGDATGIAMPAGVEYARSVVPGAEAPMAITYSAGSTTTGATVSAPVASLLLPAGRTTLVAEHVEA